MSDGQPPSEAQGLAAGGPIGSSSWASPASVSQGIDAQFALGETTASSAEDLVKVRYARHAVTPIPWMVASSVAIVAAFWAIGWSEVGRGATDIVETSEWWSNVYRVLQPAGDPRLASYSEFRMWTAMAIMVAAAISIAVWIGRLGRNLRPAHSPFGAVLPLVALPAWWVLPLTLGATDTSARSRGDALLRYLIAFGILFTQYMLVRWPLLNRIWRAGRRRYDVASILLWLPMLIPWSMLLLSSAFTLLVTGDGENPADSAWRPTATMADWADNLTKATEVGIFVLLVVVTVCQHLGITKDRAEASERRDANGDPMSLR